MAKPRMIFEPFQIKSMKLKNRIGLAPLLNMPGVWTSFSITDETIAWFEARARGRRRTDHDGQLRAAHVRHSRPQGGLRQAGRGDPFARRQAGRADRLGRTADGHGPLAPALSQRARREAGHHGPAEDGRRGAAGARRATRAQRRRDRGARTGLCRHGGDPEGGGCRLRRAPLRPWRSHPLLLLHIAVSTTGGRISTEAAGRTGSVSPPTRSRE